jgi:uracil-DNA glycosylase
MVKNMIRPFWKNILKQEESKDYFCQLMTEIEKQRAGGITIFPTNENIFQAFKYKDLPEIKVVILGQDPYHGFLIEEIPQAHGLSFSIPSLKNTPLNKKLKLPPSLVNIYKELTADIDGFVTPRHGNLTSWAEQGVLLLNTVLTVQQAKAHSHAKLGWETFTDKIISEINEHNSGCVFILWGAHAQKKGKDIDTKKHLVLNGPHPSPLSAYRGFFGCQHFSKTNTWLAERKQQAIDWFIPV